MSNTTVNSAVQRWILAALLALSAAAALNPHLNLTFSETVFQNVTYAQYFNLVENRTYSLIEGVLTVYNPGSEAVYDTDIKIINTDNLASRFFFSGGRTGTQTFLPKNTDNVTNLTFNITSSWTSLGHDIDEDGTNDSVEVNGTDIIFNVTSEPKLLNYRLQNTSGPANLNVTNVFNTTINVTSLSANGYEQGVVFATLTINGTESTLNQLTVAPAQVTITLNDTMRNYTILHIPELRSGEETNFSYNVSSVLVDPPLDINTTYSNPQFASKVLAGKRFNITDTATNIAQVGALTIINITIVTQGVTSANLSNSSLNQTDHFWLTNLNPVGDYVDVYGNGTNNRSWYWVTNGGIIPIGQTFNISYEVQAPDTVPSSATYMAIMENLTYMINATASRVAVSDVRAHADVNFSTSKQVVSPQDNLSNHNVTWQSDPNVGTFQNITYTLEKVTLWVTSTRDPNVIANSLNNTYTPNSVVNLSTSWAGASWLFNFTDGSDDVNAPPPIVWIKPYWIIANTGGQILNQSVTVNGTDLYMKYIYVVNGYWLEVQKNVTSIADNQYEIKVWVHNRGNGYTPQNLTVTVYDFIPAAFTAWNFTPNYNNLSNVSGQYTGVAYQWDVGLRTNLSNSFAPEGDSLGLDNYYLNYTVNGTGDFKVSDLYIVGLDPRRVDGAAGVDETIINNGFSTGSKDIIFAGIVAFLIAINVGNFLMTSRINKKLDKKE